MIRGSLPFVFAMVALIGLLMAFPDVVLWLPRYVMGFELAAMPPDPFSSWSQFPPITLAVRASGQPRRSIAAVRLGKSPIVRMPSGLMIGPKSTSLRPVPLVVGDPAEEFLARSPA